MNDNLHYFLPTKTSNMALEKSKEFSSKENKHTASDSFKSKVKRDKSFQTKVVVRRLPPTMAEKQFLEQISPLPDHDYMYFVRADMRLGPNAFSRAYINFINPDDIFIFKEKFDDYVFLDTKGNEYPAIVEFAPFQKIPKKRSKKKDAKSGTIENDADYLKFLEILRNPDEVTLPPSEVTLEEIETREKELKLNNGVLKMTTPLIEYIKARKVEQQKMREEKREERKRKEMEKKRIREEERRRRKAEKDKERGKDKFKEKDIVYEKETTDDVEDSSVSESQKQFEPIVQVLKNPEREKDQKEHTAPPKSKEYFVSSRFSKDKERNKTAWDRDRVRPKERQRVSDKGGYFRDKDRSRKDKPDYKLYAGKRSTENTEDAPKKSKETQKAVIEESPKVTSTEIPPFTESVEKVQWPPKDKRDNSCPGDVEPSVSRKDDDDFSENGHQPASKSKTCEEAIDVNSNSKSDNNGADYGDQSKDPRVERRIKNKDRPTLEIYRPGMRRFSTQRSSPQKEISTSASNSSSPSPTPPLMVGSSKSQTKSGEKNSSKKAGTEDKATSAGKMTKRPAN